MLLLFRVRDRRSRLRLSLRSGEFTREYTVALWQSVIIFHVLIGDARDVIEQVLVALAD